jgi:hypothetical protein
MGDKSNQMKQLKTFSIIARILFALPIGMMGLNHFLMIPLFAQQLKESLIPNGVFLIMISGLMLMMVSVFIIFNKFLEIANLWLIGLLLLIICTIHIPTLFSSDFNVAQLAYIEFLKTTSLLGAASLIAIYLYDKRQKEAEKK